MISEADDSHSSPVAVSSARGKGSHSLREGFDFDDDLLDVLVWTKGRACAAWMLVVVIMPSMIAIRSMKWDDEWMEEQHTVVKHSR